MKQSAYIIALLLLCACGGETVEIQEQYVAMRDQCQTLSEQRVQMYEQAQGQAFDGRDRNTRLVDNFNRCMGSKDWDMGKPKDAPAEKPRQATLANRGIGIGVGPGYALEPEGNIPQPLEVDPTAAVRQPTMNVPERRIEPRSNVAKPSREVPQPEGSVERVEGNVPRPETLPREAQQPQLAPTAVRPVSTATLPPPKDIVSQAPASPPNALSGYQPAPAAPGELSSGTEQELRAVLKDWQ